MDDIIYLKCIKEKNKLRVKIISDGYFNNANCRFPRDLRIENRIFTVPKYNITLINGPRGKYFYNICKPITIYNDEIRLPIHIYNDTNEPNCIICLDNIKDIIFYPCGHYNSCLECYKQFTKKTCPLCRTIIQNILTPDQIN